MSEILTISSDFATEEVREELGLMLSIEEGWDFRAGDPEIYKYANELIVPGGKVIDLGMGHARTSLFFALNGMKVYGLDKDIDALHYMNNLAVEYNLPINPLYGDVISIKDFGEEVFDLAVLSQIFVHFPSTEEAFNVMLKTVRSLKPGGHMYLRCVSKRDSSFEEFKEMSKYQEYYGVKESDYDPNVFYARCGCTGMDMVEPHIFFDESEIMAFLETRGMHIKYSQVAPSKGTMNVMYGEERAGS